MTDDNVTTARDGKKTQRRSRSTKRRTRRLLTVALSITALVLVALLSLAWLGHRAITLREELTAATALVPQLKSDIRRNEANAASATVEELKGHASKARMAAEDPLWVAAGTLPWIGPNFQAASVVAQAADDLANRAAGPLVSVYQTLDWQSLTPDNMETGLTSLAAAEPKLASAAYTVTQSSDRLAGIDTNGLLSQVSDPLVRARSELVSFRDGLNAAASAASILPSMLGVNEPRSYLLLIQNNAESRASGGIPGALAVLNVDKGRITLGEQSSASELGAFVPAVAVDAEQQQLYSERLGKYMQDVNLTPDFPTSASTAQAMWEKRTGQRVSGVISMDPVALGYMLDATGPINLTNPETRGLAGAGLPTELGGKNVVPTLLSDVYAQIKEPRLQDAYFAGVAEELFRALSDGRSDSKKLVDGITRGAAESRLILWSSVKNEQETLSRFPVSGSISGPSILPAQFGVYFNDGTGAKMDYYMKRTVQLVKECAKDGYEQTTVRVTSTNTAPADAATSLPAYVTGDGIYGVPPGSVQTNIVAYGPVQAYAETARLDGQRTDFAPYIHSNRPVGVMAIKLAPGESRTVEFTFGKIVQHTEPNVVVTPTVQAVKDVILPTKIPPCGQ